MGAKKEKQNHKKGLQNEQNNSKLKLNTLKTQQKQRVNLKIGFDRGF